MANLAPSILAGSSSFLQVSNTKNSGNIPLLTTELHISAIEHLTTRHIMFRPL